MICVDVDSFTLVYIEYGDHVHRWAVPSRYSIAMMATRMADMTDAEYPARRKADTEFEVRDEGGAILPLRSSVNAQLTDGSHVVVTRKERKR